MDKRPWDEILHTAADGIYFVTEQDGTLRQEVREDFYDVQSDSFRKDVVCVYIARVQSGWKPRHIAADFHHHTTDPTGMTRDVIGAWVPADQFVIGVL